MKEMLKDFNQIKISPVFKRLLEFITEDIDIYLPGGNAYVKW
jgi:2-hydroxy-3-keto-5-methylthiopentenyl-1-phosphate phosphatase